MLLEIVGKLKAYNETLKDPIEIGMGLNSGSLMLGTVGGENRMDGTVISDVVNVASRIENLTKKYKVSLLISEYTINKLKNPSDFSITKIDTVETRGRKEKVTIYTAN